MPVFTPQKPKLANENPFKIDERRLTARKSRMYPTTTSVEFPERKHQPPHIPRITRKKRQPLFQKLAPLILLALFAILTGPNLFSWLPKQTKTPPPVSKPLPLNFTHISSQFGPRWGRYHQGVDFAAAAGTPIYAASAGKVIYSGWEPGYGKSVILEHSENHQTRYAHCSRLLVKEGDTVDKGTMIAKVGSTGHSTGPHLHFEVIISGERKNPAWYYPFQQPELQSIASQQ